MNASICTSTHSSALTENLLLWEDYNGYSLCGHKITLIFKSGKKSIELQSRIRSIGVTIENQPERRSMVFSLGPVTVKTDARWEVFQPRNCTLKIKPSNFSQDAVGLEYIEFQSHENNFKPSWELYGKIKLSR